MRHDFGGDWTQDKLVRLRKYLEAYATLMHKNQWASRYKRIYVDAFAGTGYQTTQRKTNQDQISLFEDEDTTEREALLNGSARIALEVSPPFHEYTFIERDKDYARALEDLKKEQPLKANSIHIVEEDANLYLQRWCRSVDWTSSRAVVFLDPYGMQVEWATIEAIANTRSIDLWILFPLGMGVNRLLTKGS